MLPPPPFHCGVLVLEVLVLEGGREAMSVASARV